MVYVQHVSFAKLCTINATSILYHQFPLLSTGTVAASSETSVSINQFDFNSVFENATNDKT